jgi:hypothetical protein
MARPHVVPGAGGSGRRPSVGMWDLVIEREVAAGLAESGEWMARSGADPNMGGGWSAVLWPWGCGGRAVVADPVSASGDEWSERVTRSGRGRAWAVRWLAMVVVVDRAVAGLVSMSGAGRGVRTTRSYVVTGASWNVGGGWSAVFVAVGVWWSGGGGGSGLGERR